MYYKDQPTSAHATQCLTHRSTRRGCVCGVKQPRSHEGLELFTDEPCDLMIRLCPLVTAQTFDLILNLCVILRTAMIQQLEVHKIAQSGWRGLDGGGSVAANQLGGRGLWLESAFTRQAYRKRHLTRSHARQTGAREEGFDSAHRRHDSGAGSKRFRTPSM